ncbi:hypothetical protein MMC11_004285 [Xylographa trunciseda]|nr:hypothetical protein [Xylographa trunciseda]
MSAFADLSLPLTELWSSRLIFVYASTAVFALAVCGRFLLSRRRGGYPVVENVGESDFTTAIVGGYKKFPKSLFTIATPDFPTIIVPHSSLSEIAHLPEKKLSLDKEVYERLMGRYTKLVKSEIFTGFVKFSVQKDINKTLALLQEEAEWAVASELGNCIDWTPIPFFPTIISLVSLHLGRSFVSLPLSRDKDWINLALDYAIQTVTVASKMSSCHWLLRPIKAYMLPDIPYMKSQFTKAKKLLEPILRKRLEDALDPNFEKPNDLMQWIIDSSAEYRDDLDMHTRVQMEAVQAATFNVAFQVVHFFYDLMSHPEYVAPLREEMERTIAQGETIMQQSISRLTKLDSFLKESQRLNAMSLVTVRRFILAPVELADGSILNPGVSVAAPTYAVDRDSSIWDRPTEFDGFRFERLRARAGNESKFQFSSSR